MAQRIKGQETEIILIVNSIPIDTLTEVKSCDFSYDLETMSEGYLGETTDRKDSVFKGISGKMQIHLSNPSVFEVIAACVDKARRRTPGTRINVKATFNWPSGRRARVVIPDVEFGAFPINNGGRAEYVTVDVSFVASEARTIVT